MKDECSDKNIITSSRAICYQCEKVVDTYDAVRDMRISEKLGSVKDINVKVCSLCDTTVAFPHSESTKIREYIEKNRPAIGVLLVSHSDKVAASWCESQMCACVGAANCVGQLEEYGYSKRDWILWKDENPRKEFPLYLLNFKLNFATSREKIPLINELIAYFNLTKIEALKLIKGDILNVLFNFRDSNQDKEFKELIFVDIRYHFLEKFSNSEIVNIEYIQINDFDIDRIKIMKDFNENTIYKTYDFENKTLKDITFT
jgi:hypothetical protein